METRPPKIIQYLKKNPVKKMLLLKSVSPHWNTNHSKFKHRLKLTLRRYFLSLFSRISRLIFRMIYICGISLTHNEVVYFYTSWFHHCSSGKQFTPLKILNLTGAFTYREENNFNILYTFLDTEIISEEILYVVILFS